MSDRLPPLTALRAFEAAARHMSFADAAAELNVTPAALSFQIKSLEEHLGAPVFRRLNRAVELTEAGKALAPGTRDGFAALTAAWRAARRSFDDSILTVTAGPAITSLWLAPRMFSFAAQHPEIELRFSASLRIIDFDLDDVDVAIRFGKGDDAGLFSRPLIDEWLTPMMVPEIAKRVKTPEDLLGETLLCDDQTTQLEPAVEWDTWFRAVNVTPKGTFGPRFNQADHAVTAALAGNGVVLGRISLTENALRDGRLIAPFDLALQSSSKCRIVCPPGSETRPHVAAFIDWVEQEANQMIALKDGRRFVAATDVSKSR